jgi:hypothetical protein
MILSFSDLWELCENFHKSTTKENSLSSVIDELQLKIGVYKTLINRKDNNCDDLIKAKSKLLGEILFTITLLSLNDNINVYAALNDALRERQ